MKKIPRIVLLIETSRGFGRDLLYGIAKYSRLHGPWSFYREPGGLNRVSPKLNDWEPNGIIMRDSAKIKSLMSLGLPTILALHKQNPSPPYPRIITDSKAIGIMGAEHFLDRGFRNFAFCGFDNMKWSQIRCENFQKRVRQAGLTAHIYKQPKSPAQRSWRNEQKILSEWLSSLPKPLALMACNDDRAQHAIEACRLADLSVPDDVSILGVDNDELICELADVPLSSVALSTKMAGYMSSELLDKLIKGEEKMNSQEIPVRPTHIVTRQSTDILAIDDPNVSTAVRFIRENAKKALQVEDVANAAAISRRVLEKRFRKLLNRSVFNEIRRVRTKHCIKLLLETNMSISEIADTLNFRGVAHISRYFRKEAGMSLTDYRKKYAP